MHHTHFFLTEADTVHEAIERVTAHLNEVDINAKGCDYFTVESAIDLRTGLSTSTGARMLDPEFNTQAGVLKWLKEFVGPQADTSAKIYKDRFDRALSDKEPWAIRYYGRELSVAVERQNLGKKEVTLERAITDDSFSVAQGEWDLIGISRLPKERDNYQENIPCPILVSVDLHT